MQFPVALFSPSRGFPGCFLTLSDHTWAQSQDLTSFPLGSWHHPGDSPELEQCTDLCLFYLLHCVVFFVLCLLCCALLCCVVFVVLYCVVFAELCCCVALRLLRCVALCLFCSIVFYCIYCVVVLLCVCCVVFIELCCVALCLLFVLFCCIVSVVLLCCVCCVVLRCFVFVYCTLFCCTRHHPALRGQLFLEGRDVVQICPLFPLGTSLRASLHALGSANHCKQGEAGPDSSCLVCPQLFKRRKGSKPTPVSCFGATEGKSKEEPIMP